MSQSSHMAFMRVKQAPIFSNSSASSKCLRDCALKVESAHGSRHVYLLRHKGPKLTYISLNALSRVKKVRVPANVYL